VIPNTQGRRRYSCSREFTRKGVVDMNNDFYTYIGLSVVWIVKYILIPIGVAVLAGIITNRVLKPQPERQKKKRSHKSRF
jgi:hypothetical protein